MAKIMRFYEEKPTRELVANVRSTRARSTTWSSQGNRSRWLNMR